MCLILFAYHSHPDYPLILLANRDEFYHRPTRPVEWWPESPDLLAGKDLQAGGTWLGMTRNGRFAAVTNVREPLQPQGTKRSRGQLPLNYCQTETSSAQFGRQLQQTGSAYPGYNLLFGQYDQLEYFSNRRQRPEPISPGLHGLSNAELDTPWPKVVTGKQRLAALLEQANPDSSRLLKILSTTDVVKDESLPNTGVPLDWERRLSAIRITGPDYGTRVSTLLMVDKQGRVDFIEQDIAPKASVPRCFSFWLQR